MRQDTPENWERTIRQEDAEAERQYRAHLASAIDKLGRACEPGRRRVPAFTFDEMRALRTFVRKHI